MEEYCRILIIDDEFIMRQGLKHMADWEKEGFRIVGEVSNGREGLEMIPKVHPHIILCDIVMPEMDGVEFAGILKDKYPEVRIIVLSGYDDYQYVRPALMYGASDYILKPMLKPEELLETLAKTARQIPGLKLKKHQEASFGKMLEDYFLGKTDEVSASVVRNQFTGTFFRVYAANVRKHQGKKSMAAVLFGKAEEYLEQMKECCHELLFFNEETLCIIFNYDAKRAEWLSQEAEKLTELLTLLYGQYFAVMGQEFRSLSELREDFQKNVLPSSDKAFYNRDIHLKIVKDCVHGERKKFDFSHYSGLLASGRYQDALDMLAAYVEEAVDEELDEYQLKNISKNMFYSLLTSLEDDQEEMDKLRLQIFKEIDRVPYAEEFLEVIDSTVLELEKILGTSGCSEDRRIGKILEYIARHYEENLDLQEVASVFHFNYYYLSAYFHTKVSEGFSGYLNRIRIEHACEILRTESVPISEISGRVGYSDHSYFCRVFKKITGRTPSAYRMEGRGEER